MITLNVTKWTLNRSGAAEITQKLKAFAGVKQHNNVYKPSRPTEIVKSNTMVSKVMNVLEHEYINPFDKDIDPKKLLNLSSGIPVTDSIADAILQVLEDGITGFETFVSEQITSDTKDFFVTLPRIAIKLFSHTGKKVEIVVNGKSKIVDANSNVISRLLALSSKLNRKIDMQTALTFPLSAVPLSLARPDGSRRETDKSVFSHILLEECDPEKTQYPQKKDVVAYLIDLMALVRARFMTPDTFEDLALIHH